VSYRTKFGLKQLTLWVISFDALPACDGRTDGRTGGQVDWHCDHS